MIVDYCCDLCRVGRVLTRGVPRSVRPRQGGGGREVEAAGGVDAVAVAVRGGAGLAVLKELFAALTPAAQRTAAERASIALASAETATVSMNSQKTSSSIPCSRVFPFPLQFCCNLRRPLQYCSLRVLLHPEQPQIFFWSEADVGVAP